MHPDVGETHLALSGQACPLSSSFAASFVGSFVDVNGQGEEVDKAPDKARDEV
ncbi:MAG: hypothetical protein O3B01_32635 [Planctomycetota bacterium]|nr:hypothetical protein [Planctomycetota bacterium]